MDKVGLRVRLPKDLHKRLAGDAKVNLRSLNGEIIFRLASTYGANGAQYVEFSDAAKQASSIVVEGIRAAMRRTHGSHA